MKITCPSCGEVIPAEDLNVTADVAVCKKCNEAYAISAMVGSQPVVDEIVEGFDIRQPPPGTWFDESITGWTLGATTRSPLAFFLVPFMCIWSGGSLGGIYGMQIVNGQFNLLMSLFGIPFILGTLLFGSLAVMAACGKVVINVDRDEGTIFSGAGPFGWRRRFDWSEISRIEEKTTYGRNSAGTAISLVGPRLVNFGSMLSDGRRYYFVQALRTMLAKRAALRR